MTSLTSALKLKNRLAGELVRQQQILQRENARRSDFHSTIDREVVWTKILTLSNQLGELKGKITRANIGIYPSLERMAEIKSRISFIQMLPKREDDEVIFVGRDQEKITYKWDSFIGQLATDTFVNQYQLEINALQDSVDQYNASTQIEE